MLLAQRDKVEDSCVIVLLKLTNLNICKRTDHILLGGGGGSSVRMYRIFLTELLECYL